MASFDEQRSPLQKQIDQAVMNRVQSGMRLLQKTYGADWVEHINPERLNLASGTACVLGQLYQDKADPASWAPSGYDWAVSNIPELKDEGGGGEQYGFTVDEDLMEQLDPDGNLDFWEHLTDTWRRAMALL